MTTYEKNNLAMAAGLALTVISYTVGVLAGWLSEINYLEIFCVFTSYVCTVLCVLQSRTNYYWGLASVAAYSLLFFQSNLYSSMVLNLYLVPTLIWGWYRWRSDDDPRPVTRVDLGWWPVYVVVTLVVWWNLVQISSAMGAVLPVGDSFILAGSILAQFLLDQKKIENWIVWFVVNVVSIKVYSDAGLYLVAFQYVFFLLNTLVGSWAWFKSMKGAQHA